MARRRGGRRRGFFSRVRDFFMGSPARQQRVARQPQRVQNQLDQLLNMALQRAREQPEEFPDLQGLLQSEGLPQLDFGPIEENARRKFQEETVPTLAERFTSMGQGAQSSAGFQQALGQAGTGLESTLAALRAQLQPQFALQRGNLALRHAGLSRATGDTRRQMIPSLLQAGMQPRFDTVMQPATQGLFGAAAPALGQAAGLGLAGLFL